MKLFVDNRNVMVENADQTNILGGSFRNFRGEKRQFNDAGKRNFNLVVSPEQAEELANIGCNVKYLKPRDDDEEEATPFVKVNVAFGKYPPELYLVSKKSKKLLNEDGLGLLDGVVFKNADLVLRTYHRDEHSCSLYLQRGFFEIKTDPITAKYEDYMDTEDLEEDEAVPFN